MPPGDRDHAAVQRGRRVVGVPLELGGDAQCLGAGLPRAAPLLRVRSEHARNARRGRVAEAPPTGEPRAHAQWATASGTAERPHRGVGLVRRIVALGRHLEVDAERDRDRVERGAEVGRRSGDANAPTVSHAGQPRASARSSRPIATERAEPTGIFDT